MLRGQRGASDVTLATGRKEKTVLGAAGFPVAHVIATRDGGFDLHVSRSGAVEVAPGAAGEWRELAAGAQRGIMSGDRLRVREGLGGSMLYVCELPTGRDEQRQQQPRKQLRQQQPTPQPALDGEPAMREAVVAQLAALAKQDAGLRAQLTSGLTGPTLRDAERSLAAAHEAHVTMAMGIGSAPTQQQASRAAAGKLKKHLNDGEKKRKWEEVSHERAAHRAERRDTHTPAQPRPKPPAQHGGATPHVAKRDRRTFNNRAEARKVRRVGEDQRQQQPPPQRQPPPQQQMVYPTPGGKGRGGGGKGGTSGKGGGGKGRGGKGGGGKGGGGKGGSFGGGRGGSFGGGCGGSFGGGRGGGRPNHWP